jgi:hypothetical protein
MYYKIILDKLRNNEQLDIDFSQFKSFSLEKFMHKKINNSLSGVERLSFKDSPYLEDISKLDLSRTKNLASAFENCFNLKQLPEIKLANATNISCMFENCISIEKITLTTFQANDFFAVFKNCINLKKVNLIIDSIDIIFERTFENCISLEEINIIFPKNAHLAFPSDTFSMCSKLKKVNKEFLMYVLDNDIQIFDDCVYIKESYPEYFI